MLAVMKMFCRRKSLASDASATPWTAESLTDFFQRFRPHGAGVGAAPCYVCPNPCSEPL